MAQPERILIVGVGKSGTTALYFKIKNSLPGEVDGFFEPRHFAPLGERPDADRPLIAKVLTPLPADFLPRLADFFTRRILIVRNPRDVIVSTLLYTSAYHYLWRYPPERIAAALALLQRKETDPAAVSVLALFEILRDDFTRSDFAAFVNRMVGAALELADREPAFFRLTYEDLIAGRLAALEDYLGFPLTASAAVDEEYQRVERTKASGGWRDWFRPEDVDYFRPLLHAYLDRFGYDTGDWALNPCPRLLPRHGSAYVLRVLNERRQREGLPPITHSPAP